MIDFLKNWKGAIEINGVHFNQYSEIPSDIKIDDNTTISLLPINKVSAGQEAKASEQEYRITVRQYMTRNSTPDFDFMAKFNNDNPMPLRTMVGVITKETRGMYYAELKADTTFKNIQTCMKCGRPITNPVSQFFGMGPECGCHNYVNPFETEEELNEAVEIYKKEYLGKITWSGWIIKSAITEMQEV